MINGNEPGNFGHTPIQLRLWEVPDLDPTKRVKAAMREALKICGLSREKVISDMNAMGIDVGVCQDSENSRVTMAILEKWVAASAPGHVIPLRWLPIFCQVTRSILPWQALTAGTGFQIISLEESRLLEWAKLESTRRKVSKHAKKLAQEAGLI